MQQQPQDGIPLSFYYNYDTNYNGYCPAPDADPNQAYTDTDFYNAGSVVQDDVANSPAPDIAPTPDSPIQQVFVTGRYLPKDPAIESLNLSPATRLVAYNLKDQFPNVVFVSGRRNVSRQFKAMAQNLTRARSTFMSTYARTPFVRAIEAWLAANPGATSAADIEAGLYAVAANFSQQEVEGISKHTSGQAFDIVPVNGSTGDAISAFLRGQPGRFLNREGGLRRWHYQR